MKRFWLGAIFFCMVCLCYAQQNEPVSHEETETVESPAADKTAEISEAVEENRGNTERKYADESQNTGMDTKTVQDAAEKNAIRRLAAVSRDRSGASPRSFQSGV